MSRILSEALVITDKELLADPEIDAVIVGEPTCQALPQRNSQGCL